MLLLFELHKLNKSKRRISIIHSILLIILIYRLNLDAVGWTTPATVPNTKVDHARNQLKVAGKGVGELHDEDELKKSK